MRVAPSVLLLLFLATGPVRVRGCDTGLLLLGGYNTAGPVTAPPQLLTSSGWCQDVRLPPLPDTLDSLAAAYVKGSVVVACGFSSSPHCRYTEPSWDNWEGMMEPEGGWWSANYQMAWSRSVGALMMTVSGGGSLHMFYNPLQASGPSIPPWTPWGSPFTFDRTVGDACLSESNLSDQRNEIVLSGGQRSESCGLRCSLRRSDEAVSSWGTDLGPPDWQEDLAPGMVGRREAHGCVGVSGGGVVAGGGGYDETFYHPVGPTENKTTLKSTEFFDGTVWTTQGDFVQPRRDFRLAEMCGEVLAVGGRQLDGHRQAFQGEFTEVFLDTVEKMHGDLPNFQWAMSDIRLPTPMAGFASAVVEDLGLFCGDAHTTDTTAKPEETTGKFVCPQDGGLFPIGDCEPTFRSCSGGWPYLQECDPGLVFNKQVGVCDWPENVDGCN